MGDASLKAPAFQSFQDKPVADSSIGDFAKDNVGKDCASSVKMGDPPEPLSNVNDSQRIKEDGPFSGKDAQRQGEEDELSLGKDAQRRAEADQSDLSGLNGKDAQRQVEDNEPFSGKDAERQGEADQSDLSGLNGNVLLYGDNQESGEKNVDANSSEDCSPSSKNAEECEQQIVGTLKEPASVLPLQSSSSTYESPMGEECAKLNHDLSIQSAENSRPVSDAHKVESESANGDGNYLPSKSSIDREKTEVVIMEEKRDGLKEELGSMNEVSDILMRSLSEDISQSPLFSPVSDSPQHQSQATDKLVGDTEILPLSTSTGNGEVNVGFQNEMDSFLDPSNQEWSDLDFGEATLISTDIEGWQRFDTEEVVTAQGADPGGVKWEQLLDDGLGSIEKNVANHPLQLALPPAYKENQSELASPGNPFIEGLERASGFSEADGMATSTEGKQNAVKSSTAIETQTKPHLHSSASLDFMEPFEAPSFMSLVDPKSHALFEASMPTYQAKHSGYRHESGEEQWVANFDLVAPSTQEISRSISMPRSGSDTPGQRPGQSVSFTVNREQEPSKKENQSLSAHRSISGFLSPKVSPLVQKVVDKVRSTPAAANGVLNSVRQAMSPKAPGKKSTSGSLLTRCICW